MKEQYLFHSLPCYLLLWFLSSQGRILERLGICQQVSFIRWFRAQFLTHINPVPSCLRVKDMRFCQVPVRVYESTLVSEGLRRGLMYFHGGGWVTGNLGITSTNQFNPTKLCVDSLRTLVNLCIICVYSFKISGPSKTTK